MAAKKIKLDEPAISEILDADTDSESGAETSDLEDEFYEFEEQASAQDEPQAATSGGGSPAWGLPQGRNIKIHPFVGPAKGLKNSEALHINKDSSPLAVMVLFFHRNFSAAGGTNLYYRQHLDRQAGHSRRLPDITLPDIMTFTALALQMGHNVKDTLHDYWSGLKQLHTPFYGETMTRDRFLHILRVCTLRTIHIDSTQAYPKFYNPSEHLAVDEVIVIFQGTVIFRQHIPKKRKCFGIKIY